MHHVGHDCTARAHEIIRRNREHVVPRSCCGPHFVVLQQVRVNEHAKLSCVTEGRHAACRFGTLLPFLAAVV